MLYFLITSLQACLPNSFCFNGLQVLCRVANLRLACVEGGEIVFYKAVTAYGVMIWSVVWLLMHWSLYGCVSICVRCSFFHLNMHCILFLHAIALRGYSMVMLYVDRFLFSIFLFLYRSTIHYL